MITLSENFRALFYTPFYAAHAIGAYGAENVEVQLRVRQVQASMSLVRAIGGGWSAQALPLESMVIQSPRFPSRDIPLPAIH